MRKNTRAWLAELPRVKSVSPGKRPWTLAVMWAGGERSVADLTGLIHRSRHFRRFLDDPTAFRAVKPIDMGIAIGWANGIDYSAASLKMLSDEQRPLSGKDLLAFEAAHGFNTAETAALFDIAERTVRAYRAAKRLPQSVSVALRAFAANQTIVDAHYRPTPHRPRGRPKTLAA